MRYSDPELGPRQIPAFEQPELGKEAITSSAQFNIDLQSQKVTIQENGRKIELGR